MMQHWTRASVLLWKRKKKVFLLKNRQRVYHSKNKQNNFLKQFSILFSIFMLNYGFF